VRRKICIGPVLTFGVINVIGFGAHARYRENWGFGIDYQFFPSITVSGTSANWSLFTAEGRWYPWGGAFFLGLGFGFQTFTASMTQEMPSGTVALEGSIGMPALKLGLGFMGGEGFVMGIDLGLNIPLGGNSVDFDPPTGLDDGSAESAAQVAELRRQINDAADKIVKVIPVVPQLNLIRIGYLF